MVFPILEHDDVLGQMRSFIMLWQDFGWNSLCSLVIWKRGEPDHLNSSDGTRIILDQHSLHLMSILLH